MPYDTDGALPKDINGYPAEGVYVPGIGTVAQQGGTPTTDSTGTPSAPTVVTGVGGAPLAMSISTNNTGLPVNIPTIVQKASGKSTGSVATLAQAFTGANVAGNSIVVVAACGNGTAMTVADSAGNTYTQAVTAPNSTTFEAAIFYAVNIVAGPNTVTVTNAGTAASMAVTIYEASGLLAQVIGELGQTSTGTGTGTTASTSNIAASTPNSLAFCGVAIGTATVTGVTAGTNWTNDSGTQQPTTPAGLFQFAAFSQYVPHTSPFTVSQTWTGSEPWACASAVFKSVSVGVQGTVHIGGYNKTNITTGTTTLVKTGAGVLHAVSINKLVASATIELDDALTNTNSFGIITLPGTITALAPFSITLDAQFSTGLSITTSGATDVTVTWK